MFLRAHPPDPISPGEPAPGPSHPGPARRGAAGRVRGTRRIAPGLSFGVLILGLAIPRDGRGSTEGRITAVHEILGLVQIESPSGRIRYPLPADPTAIRGTLAPGGRVRFTVDPDRITDPRPPLIRLEVIDPADAVPDPTHTPPARPRAPRADWTEAPHPHRIVREADPDRPGSERLVLHGLKLARDGSDRFEDAMPLTLTYPIPRPGDPAPRLTGHILSISTRWEFTPSPRIIFEIDDRTLDLGVGTHSSRAICTAMHEEIGFDLSLETLSTLAAGHQVRGTVGGHPVPLEDGHLQVLARFVAACQQASETPVILSPEEPDR